MSKPLSSVALAAALALMAAAPAHAATAANSQNGTNSSNPNATVGAPTSTSAMPATNMDMGSTSGGTTMRKPAATGTGETTGTGAGTAPDNQ